MKFTRLGRCLGVSAIGAGPAGGFLFGLINAGDPDPNPVGRVVYACMMAVVTPLHAGFPPRNDAGVGQSFNVWPYIAVAALLIFAGCAFRSWRADRKRSGR